MAKQKNKKSDGKSLNLDISRVEAIKQSITKDVKKEVKAWIWKPISIFLIITGFWGWTTYQGIKRLQGDLITKATKDLEEKVKTLYSKMNVEKVVDDLVKENAEDLIKDKVKLEVDPVVTEIKKDQEEYSKVLIEFKKQQERYAEITSLNELAVAAGNGDKEAFIKLNKLTVPLNSKYSSFAVQVVTKVYDTYFGKDSFTLKYYKAQISDKEVISHLNSKDFITRKLAVSTIKKRKMYDQVPKLIAMIKTEPTLDVLALISKVLNDLLNTNINILHDNARNDFTKAWAKKKAELSKTKSTN